MTRRGWIIVSIVVLVTVGAVAWRLSPSTVQGQLALAGDVRSDVRTVQAPAISYPTPDVSVGIPQSQPQSLALSKRTRAQPPASQVPTVSGMLDAVYVRQGDSVATGQPVAQLNTALLDLGVAQARATAKRAHTQVDVMSENLDTIATNQSKLADAKSQLATAEKQLTTAKAQIKTGKAQLQAGIAQIEAQINGPHPPGPWPPPALAAQLAQIKTSLAAVVLGEQQMAVAEGQLSTGKAKLATGASALRDAKVKARDARELLGIVATGQDILVDVAKYNRSQATVVAPASGTVTQARDAGTVAMVGAPLVRIRPEGRTEVDTYVTPAELAITPLGTKADVDFDSNTGGTLHGTVTRVAVSAAFPPTSFPTDIIHMTRAVRVTISLDEGGWAPPGTPVDVVLHTSVPH